MCAKKLSEGDVAMATKNLFEVPKNFQLSAEERTLVRRLEGIRRAIQESWRLNKERLENAAAHLRELSGLGSEPNSTPVSWRRPPFKKDTDYVWGMFVVWGPASDVWNTLDCSSVLADLSAEQFFVVLAQVEWELAVENLLYRQHELASGKGLPQKWRLRDAASSSAYAEWALGIARAKTMQESAPSTDKGT